MAFAIQARKMHDFMNRFYKHLQDMETEFDSSVDSTY